MIDNTDNSYFNKEQAQLSRKDLKLRDMHMKRRDPELYLNDDTDVDHQI